MTRRRQGILWIVASIILTALFLSVIFSASYQQAVTRYVKTNAAAAPVTIILVRAATNILAPLPGSPVAFASLAVLPWWQAWLYNLAGIQLGAISAFFIARRFREPVVARFVSLRDIHAWQERISPRRQFWGFAGLRLVAILAYDFVSYAAGLTKLPFLLFLGASLLVDVPLTLTFFYLGGAAYRYGVYLMLVIVVMFVMGALIFKRTWSKR